MSQKTFVTVSFALLFSTVFAMGACTVPPNRPRMPDAGPGPVDAPGLVFPDVPYVDPMSCVTGPGLDADEDGFVNEEDCNDCSAQINPGAFDFPGDGYDEDCTGADATSVGDCDGDLALDSGDPFDAARSMGLCEITDEGSRRWGVIDARFVRADGSGSPRSPLQYGFLPALGGQAPVQGYSLLALSSGVARGTGHPDFTSGCDLFGLGAEGYPPGYPVESPACPGVRSGAPYDSVALEVRIRVPSNARSMSFASAFFTYEYPEFICDEFNDFFVVLREGPSGWENLVRDMMGNAVSVNNAFLAACVPGTHGGRRFDCPLGTGFLAGTGYDGTMRCGYDPFAGVTGGVGGSTGWLRTTAPVAPGEILTLRFALWDSGDADLDSLALVDGWTWDLEAVEITETEPIVF